jgi:acyl carrier protein
MKKMDKLKIKDVFSQIVLIIEGLSGDWEYPGEIKLETTLLEDMGFESIDAVALGSAIEEHYGQSIPFAQYLSELGERGASDITLGELAEFVHSHL